jgi:hypothetical protein
VRNHPKPPDKTGQALKGLKENNMSISENVSMFYNVNPHIRNNKTGMHITSIGDTKKSPIGDLGVKNSSKGGIQQRGIRWKH